MSKDFEQHIPRIQELGLTQITPQQKDHIAMVFGANFMNPATNHQRQEARRYLTGPVKEKFERGLAKSVWNLGGRIVADMLASRVGKIEADSGYYSLNVGFDGHNQDILKIKTLKSGSDLQENGLFQGASFSSEDAYVKDKILPGTLPKILRSGLDELPQLEYIANGKMFLVGPRAYSRVEREANRILYKLKDNTDLNNSDEVKWILEIHPNIDPSVKPGINNPRSCLRVDLVSHMTRMFLDILYMQKASPSLDMTILIKSLDRRFRRAGRVMKQLV